MTAPSPRENDFLLGHDAAETAMLDAIRSNRIHHAWLITGPAGIGKATLAFRFARRLFAKHGPGPGLYLAPDDPIFRRVAAGSHADLLTIERGYDEKRKRSRSEIVVDDVRDVADFMRLTPAEDGWRVVVIDGVEYLNRNAANALLKILEEPPRRALLLLTCAAPGRLLPTIRSRCRRLRLAPLADAPIRQVLDRYLPEQMPEQRAELVSLAEGSPGRALLLAEEGGVAIARMVDQVLQDIPTVSPLRGYDLADQLARSETGYTTFMDLLRTSLAGAIRQEARGTAPARLSRFRPLDAWGSVWQSLTQLQDETERFNLDKRQALISGLTLLNGS